ncbi:hypothetical protein MAUB_23070 [Mycolicibacterium aubagnense]|uniref:Uncharacterized protein n=1 Tax=Mycolicibacterium aubagnense TaxID=319707 RepID=A0ABM7ICP0_9MYCO|nr:hypothetical protein [Mycolicibacterium aubagnense]WGI35755.1 hypothetical protein QDT91_05395 [Mycolicibacterium aubagnense]BBX84434.1 hypothetical protein MAUB_23070 [Mycolicibacterium aubagnense]
MTVATWGVVKQADAVGFDFSREYLGASSKHFPFDWRPDGEVPGAVQVSGSCCCS